MKLAINSRFLRINLMMTISSWSEFRSRNQTWIFVYKGDIIVNESARLERQALCVRFVGTQSFNVTGGRDLAWWRFRSENVHPERVPFPVVCRSETWRICEEVHRSWIGAKYELTQIRSTSRPHVEECSHRTKYEGRRIDVMVSLMISFLHSALARYTIHW